MTPIDPDALQRGLESVAAYPAVKGAVDVVKSTIVDPIADEIKKPVAEWAREKLVPSVRRILRLEDAAQQAAEDAAAVLGQGDPKRLIEPAPEVFASVVEGYQTRAEIPELRAMFARLLATAMVKDERGLAHPSFAEVIRQMTGEEARVFGAVVSNGPYFHIQYAADRDLTMDERNEQLRRAWEILAQEAQITGAGVVARVGYALGNLTRLGLIRNIETVNVDSGTPVPTGRAVLTTEFGDRFAAVCLSRGLVQLPAEWETPWGSE
jgi:hypothetical protein